MFTPEHIELLAMYDNRGQQSVHRILILALAGFASVLWILRPIVLPRLSSAWVARPAGFLARYGGWLLAAGVIVAAIVNRQPRLSDSFGFQGSFPLGPALSLRTQLLIALLAFIALRATLNIPRTHPQWGRRTGRTAIFIFAVYGLAIVVLPMVRFLDLSAFSPELLSGVEWHYSGSVGSADRFAAGEVLGDVPIHSGLLPSVALGAWQHSRGMLTFGEHVAFIQGLQLVVLVACILGYGLWYSWRPAPWLAASLLLLPWVQPLHAAVLYPNQSAWRFLAFCLGVVLMTLLRSQPLSRSAPVLGLAAGSAVLWNVETGLCLVAAYLAFIILRFPSGGSRRELVGGTMTYLGGIAAAFAAFAIFARAVQGAWPDLSGTIGSLPLIRSFLGGYAGWKFRQVEPIAVLIFAHSLFVLLRGLLTWASGPGLDARHACRAALAALVILWSSYYIKGPDPWNLWSALFVYGFLVADLLPDAHASSSVGPLTRSGKVMAALLIVTPAIVATNAGTVGSLFFALRQGPCPESRALSGICVAADLAPEIRAKAAALVEHSQRSPVLYFTANTYFMPIMTGVRLPMRTRDAFSDTTLLHDFDRLVSDVKRLAPACILFDDPASRLSGYEVHRKFYRRLRVEVTRTYGRVGLDRGWQVWCR
jgi:hypothetical protein